MSYVTNSLLNEETWRVTCSVSSSQVLASEKIDRSSHSNPHVRKKSKPRSKSRNKIICHYCSRANHINRECRNFERDKEEGKLKVNDDETATNTAIDDDLLVV